MSFAPKTQPFSGKINAVTLAADTPGHSWQIVSQGKSSIAHKGMLYAGKVMAATVIDLMKDPELLAAAKAAKINAINEFDASANVNAFTVSGNPMWLNHDQRSRLSASIAVCTDATMTKYFSGVAYTFPVAAWKQMLDAVELYADTCQTVTEAHKAEVNALTTVAAVEAYDITIGYPPKLNF